MKKSFIFLAIIMFFLMMTSCKEKNPQNKIPKEYEVYEKSEYLNKKILDPIYYNTVDPIESLSLENFDERMKGCYLSRVTASKETNDYYVCGYLNNEAKEKFENCGADDFDNGWNSNFKGRNGYIVNYIFLALNKTIDVEKYPIKWYKVPKGVKVELEMEDMFLLIASASVKITCQNLENNEISEVEMLYENSTFYGGNVDSSNLNIEYLTLINETSFLQEEVVLSTDFSLYMVGFGFNMTYYDDVAYVRVGHNTIYKDLDLKESYEYKKDEYGDYLFKLDDFLKSLNN